MPALEQNLGRRRPQPGRCDDRHLASILGSTFETLKALISGHLAFVPELTHSETAQEPPWQISNDYRGALVRLKRPPRKYIGVWPIASCAEPFPRGFRGAAERRRRLTPARSRL